jgi:hypothetical protein
MYLNSRSRGRTNRSKGVRRNSVRREGTGGGGVPFRRRGSLGFRTGGDDAEEAEGEAASGAAQRRGSFYKGSVWDTWAFYERRMRGSGGLGRPMPGLGFRSSNLGRNGLAWAARYGVIVVLAHWFGDFSEYTPRACGYYVAAPPLPATLRHGEQAERCGEAKPGGAHPQGQKILF